MYVFKVISAGFQSPNGTFLNLQLLKKNESQQIKNGDTITLSPSTKYKFDSEVLEQETIADILNKLVDTVEENCKKKVKEPPTGLEIIDEELSCSICYELFVNATILNCSHTFCKYCIDQWRKTNNACPICRERITTQLKNGVVDSYIEKYLSTANEESKMHRKSVVEGRTQPKAEKRKAPEQVIDLDSSDTADEDMDEESFGEDDDYSYFDVDYEYDEDDEYNDADYDGLPGAYYGGYGNCYICGSRNHWANGCPDNPRRRRQ